LCTVILLLAGATLAKSPGEIGVIDTPYREPNELKNPDGCDSVSYHGAPYYYWTIPDQYGDDFFNERFTATIEPWPISRLAIAFSQQGSVGNPGAEFILFNSESGLPTDTIAVYTVDTITSWYPDWTVVDCEADNIELWGEFHLGFTPVFNDSGDVLACLSDDGSGPILYRSSEYWGGSWGLMLDDWGVDVDFLMRVVYCSPNYPPAVECIPADSNVDWPTYSHDFARTAFTPVEIGDRCGFQRIWEYQSPYDFCYYSNPTIAGNRVYATFGIHLVCLDLETGSVIWDTYTHSDYGGIVGSNIRTSPTIHDGYL
jgi:hypothetical protein